MRVCLRGGDVSSGLTPPLRFRFAGRTGTTSVLLVSLWACTPGEPGGFGDSFDRVDSAGVTVTVNRLDAPGAPPERLLKGWTPVVGGDGRPLVFLDVSDAFPTRGGELVVLEPTAPAVHRIGSDGRVITMGRAGDGPGEFRRPSRILPLPGDSVGVWDPRHRRITVFGSTGIPDREIHLDPARLPPAVEGLNVAPVGWFPDGALLVEALAIPPDAGRVRADVTLFRIAPGWEAARELLTVPGEEYWVEVETQGPSRSRMMYPAPFGHRHQAVVTQDGHVVLTGAQLDQVEIRSGESGEMLGILRIGGPPRPIDQAALAADRAALEAAGVDPTIIDGIRKRVEASAPPGHRPRVGRFLVSESGVGARLSAMMFLQFFIWGAWYTVIAVYMTQEGMETLTH